MRFSEIIVITVRLFVVVCVISFLLGAFVF